MHVYHAHGIDLIIHGLVLFGLFHLGRWGRLWVLGSLMVSGVDSLFELSGYIGHNSIGGVLAAMFWIIAGAAAALLFGPTLNLPTKPLKSPSWLQFRFGRDR